MKAILDEQNACTIRASFEDENEAAVTPISMSYRVDDLTGGVATVVVANTAVVPSTSYYDIEIPATSNVVLDQSHDYETRLVTVKFVYGASSKQGAGEYEYLLKNLRRIEVLLA